MPPGYLGADPMQAQIMIKTLQKQITAIETLAHILVYLPAGGVSRNHLRLDAFLFLAVQLPDILLRPLIWIPPAQLFQKVVICAKLLDDS